jgi:hypothetical protein
VVSPFFVKEQAKFEFGAIGEWREFPSESPSAVQDAIAFARAELMTDDAEG